MYIFAVYGKDTLNFLYRERFYDIMLSFNVLG